jgi:mono/diheme cytochrome c family protein
MKRMAGWGWAVCVVLAVAGATGLSRAEGDAAMDSGHRLFQKHCEVCHGRSGRGDGPLAEDLKVPPADLTGIAMRRGGTFPDAELAAIIDGTRRVRGHGSDMPIWGREFAGPRSGGAPGGEARQDRGPQRLSALDPDAATRWRQTLSARGRSHTEECVVGTAGARSCYALMRGMPMKSRLPIGAPFMRRMS